MMASNSPTLVLGRGSVADAIVERLDRDTPGGVVALTRPDAARVVALGNSLAGAVIVAPPGPPPCLFLDITDERLDAQLADFLDVFECLGALLGRLDPNGAIVLIGDRGYLGAWGAADARAFSGAHVALMRCVTLEGFGAGHRANCIALDLAEDGASTAPGEIANLAAYLVAPESQAINGEIILANRGRSLRIREAKDRRADFAATASSKGPTL